MTNNPAQLKNFLLGLSLSVIVIVSFFIGGLADRIFVIKPLDYITGKRTSLLDKIFSQRGSNLADATSVSTTTFSVADVAEQSAEAVVTISIKKTQKESRKIDVR